MSVWRAPCVGAIDSPRHKILIRWTVPSNEQVGISPCINIPAVRSPWRNDDIVSDLERRRFLAERVGDPAAKNDGVFRVCVPVQLEARPGGKMSVVRLSARFRIDAQNGALRAPWNSQRSRVRLTPVGRLQMKRRGRIGRLARLLARTVGATGERYRQSCQDRPTPGSKLRHASSKPRAPGSGQPWRMPAIIS